MGDETSQIAQMSPALRHRRAARVLALVAAAVSLALAANAPAAGLPSITVKTPVLPPVTVSTPAVPPVTVSLPTKQPITVSTPAVPPITVSTPSVPSVTVTTPALPDADIPVPTPTMPTPPTIELPGGGSVGASPPPASGSNPTPGAGTGTGTGGGAGAASGSTGTGQRGSGTGAPAGSQTNAAGSPPIVQTQAVSERSATGPAVAPSVKKKQHGLAQIGENVIDALPTAILFALICLALIAATMSINAYLQGRRAKRLNQQRDGLLDDVGVLQAALLPDVPDRVGDLSVTVGYRPAQGLAAGGDFYDVFELDETRTAIILGDVSGHGRESLIHAALVRYTLRTLMGEGHALGEVLARADRYLESDMSSNFATVIVATYDHDSAELRYAKAGHEPPLISGVDNMDEDTACPLGLGLGDAWPEFAHGLRPDQTVCLYTDGLKEARRGGQQLGRSHIEGLLAEGLDAPALIERVEHDADTAFDDLAAVVLKNVSRESAARRSRLPRRGGHTSTPTSPATTATASATVSTNS